MRKWNKISESQTILRFFPELSTDVPKNLKNRKTENRTDRDDFQIVGNYTFFSWNSLKNLDLRKDLLSMANSFVF